MRFLLGLIFGIALVPLAALAFLTYGNVPVAVSDPADSPRAPGRPHAA